MNMMLDTAQAKCKDDLPQKAPHPRKHANRLSEKPKANEEGSITC